MSKGFSKRWKSVNPDEKALYTELSHLRNQGAGKTTDTTLELGSFRKRADSDEPDLNRQKKQCKVVEDDQAEEEFEPTHPVFESLLDELDKEAADALAGLPQTGDVH